MSGKVHGGKGKSGAKDGGLHHFTSHSLKAGLQFPVGRVKRFLKQRAQNKVRVGAKGEYLRVFLSYRWITNNSRYLFDCSFGVLDRRGIGISW